MFQKSLRHSCSSGVFLSKASRLAFLQETARIFTKASPKDANSALFGRFQAFSAGWSNIYAFRNASVFSKSDFEAENGLFSIFSGRLAECPSGKFRHSEVFGPQRKILDPP